MHTHTTSALDEAVRPRIALRLLLQIGAGPPVELIWSPPDIPDLCDGREVLRRRGEDRLVPREWTKAELRLKERFGGILLSYHARERLKNEPPSDDSPLADFVRYALNVAWALYSRAIFLEGRRCSFERYLRAVLLTEPRFDWWWITEASQALRLSLGLARFPRTTLLPPFPPRQR